MKIWKPRSIALFTGLIVCGGLAWNLRGKDTQEGAKALEDMLVEQEKANTSFDKVKQTLIGDQYQRKNIFDNSIDGCKAALKDWNNAWTRLQNVINKYIKEMPKLGMGKMDDKNQKRVKEAIALITSESKLLFDTLEQRDNAGKAKVGLIRSIDGALPDLNKMFNALKPIESVIPLRSDKPMTVRIKESLREVLGRLYRIFLQVYPNANQKDWVPLIKKN